MSRREAGFDVRCRMLPFVLGEAARSDVAALRLALEQRTTNWKREARKVARLFLRRLVGSLNRRDEADGGLRWEAD